MDKFQEKRNQIKEAGGRLFATYGFKKTTLEDIAGEVGIKKNSLYYYFESKDAIFDELINDSTKIYFEKQYQILNSNISVQNKLFNCAIHLIRHTKGLSCKYSLTIKSFREINRVIAELHPEFKLEQKQIFKKILKEGINKKIFRKHNTNIFAEDLMLIIQSIEYRLYDISGVLLLKEIDFTSIEETIKRIITYLINSIKT